LFDEEMKIFAEDWRTSFMFYLFSKKFLQLNSILGKVRDDLLVRVAIRFNLEILFLD